jgi:hypothetical protein
MANMSKRKFIAASIGAGIGLSAVRKALAQEDTAGPARVRGICSESPSSLTNGENNEAV